MGSFLKVVFFLSICLAFTHAEFNSSISQAAASRQIKEWQHRYNSYIFKTLKHRTSGCTLDKLQYRQEWYVLHKTSVI